MTPTRKQAWTDLCSAAEVPAEGGRYVTHGNRALAVFRVPGGIGGESFRVMDDACPHAGGSLSAGTLEQQMYDGVCVVCPWHGWAFDVHDGTCPDNEAIRVRVSEARVVDGRVQARL